MRAPGWWRCGNRCLIWSKRESLKVDTCSISSVPSSSSPLVPGIRVHHKIGHLVHSQEILRLVKNLLGLYLRNKKQGWRTKTAWIWYLLHHYCFSSTPPWAHEFDNTGWSYQTVIGKWVFTFSLLLIIYHLSFTPSAYPDNFLRWSLLVDATSTWLQQRACANIQCKLEYKNL